MSKRDAHSESIDAAAARWVTRRDAGLTAIEVAELAQWRAADAQHEAAWRQHSAAWSRLDRPHEAGAILQELRARGRRRRRIASAAAMSAALLIVVLATSFWRTRSDLQAPPRIVAAPGGLLLAPEKRLLPDGSIVELKSGAEISIEFSPAVRRVVLLAGEAHFQVAKNAAWPFAVDAGGVHVRAVGTAFTVQRQAVQVDVVVTEGRIAIEKAVAISSADGERSAPGATAEAESAGEPLAFADAGQRVVVSARPAEQPTAVSTVSPEEIAERLAWRTPRVEFSATPLAEAVAMMNRSAAESSGLQLVIDAASATLAKEPVSGIFRADNTETFVRMLELSLAVQVERRGNQILLRKGN